MAGTLIDLGNIPLVGDFPDKKTVTAAGNYHIDIGIASDPTVTFDGQGTPTDFTLTSVAATLTSYTLIATNGANLTVTGLAGIGNVTNLVIDGNSSILVETGIAVISPINASFTGGGGGTLTLEPSVLSLLTTPPAVTGFGPGDHIDFGTTALAAGDKTVYAADTDPAAGGTVSLETAGGTVIGTVTIVGQDPAGMSYNASNFVVGTEGIDFACFLQGTLIMTANGEIAVETIRAGDQVMTLTNGPVAVKAVRHRRFAEADAAGMKIRPICITAGAFGENTPRRDLYVSPDHAMFLDNVLVPAQLLVNGETIFQPMPRGEVNYYHIEIDPHDLIIAEGAATESYLDIGNRGHFGRIGAVAWVADIEPKTWEDACAPLVLGGKQLAAIQARLALRAAKLTRRPMLAEVA